MKKLKNLWIVRIIWRDACISFGKDSENTRPGETQMSIGILLPKMFRDEYGKQYFRVLQNYGERQDDFTDIPRSWAVYVENLVRIPFDYVKIEELMGTRLNHANHRKTA